VAGAVNLLKLEVKEAEDAIVSLLAESGKPAASLCSQRNPDRNPEGILE
jgi:hypothetical protein